MHYREVHGHLEDDCRKLYARLMRSRHVGFTLIELMVVLVIVAISIATVAFSLSPSDLRIVEQERDRIKWVIEEAHSQAVRRRSDLQLQITNKGYAFLNLPQDLESETWARPHETAVEIELVEAEATYTILAQPVLAACTMRLRLGQQLREAQC